MAKSTLAWHLGMRRSLPRCAGGFAMGRGRVKGLRARTHKRPQIAKQTRRSYKRTMQHMRNSAIILAALLAAMLTLAAAEARSEEQSPVEAEVLQPKKQWVPLKQCLKVNIDPGMAFPTYVKYADTVHCFLRIDGKIIINRMCHVDISQQLREWTMEVPDLGVADVWMKYYYSNDDISDKLRRSFYAFFEKNGKSLNYGRVNPAQNNRQEHICLQNKRFRMCFSQPYLICDPERVKAQQAN